MFLFNCATLGYVSLYFIFSKRSEIFMKRLKQIGALLAIAVLIGFGLGAMIFAFIDTPFAHKALTVCLCLATPLYLRRMVNCMWLLCLPMKITNGIRSILILMI